MAKMLRTSFRCVTIIFGRMSARLILPPLDRGVPDVVQPHVTERTLAAGDHRPSGNARLQVVTNSRRKLGLVQRNSCQHGGLGSTGSIWSNGCRLADLGNLADVLRAFFR